MRSFFLPAGLTALLLAAGCNSDRNEPEVTVVDTAEPDDAAAPATTDAVDPAIGGSSAADSPSGFTMPEDAPPIQPPAAPEAPQATADPDDQAAAQTPPEAEPREPLLVGSQAPPLDIEHWVQKGQEGFEPVSDFEEGKVYVVEFWATWCGPCISSMPHLAETQQKYADQGLRIISVSNEPLKTVESFLERPAPTEEEPDRTFGQLTSVYSLTTDPDESVYEDYMRAADQNGIPTAFIVGKSGLVEWIGHPMRMDEPLDAVIEGSWDREAYAEQFLAEQRVQETVQRAFGLARQGKTDDALAALNEALAETELPQAQRELKQYKLQLLVAMGDRPEEVNQLGSEMLQQAGDDDAAVNSVTWLIYQAASQGTVPDTLVAQAIEAGEAAVEDMEKDERAYLLDTIAHLHEVSGDMDAAIATQQEAVDVAESNFKKRLQEYLDELKASKAEKEKETEVEDASPDADKAADAEDADAESADAVEQETTEAPAEPDSASDAASAVQEVEADAEAASENP